MKVIRLHRRLQLLIRDMEEGLIISSLDIQGRTWLWILKFTILWLRMKRKRKSGEGLRDLFWEMITISGLNSQPLPNQKPISTKQWIKMDLSGKWMPESTTSELEFRTLWEILKRNSPAIPLIDLNNRINGANLRPLQSNWTCSMKFLRHHQLPWPTTI